MTNGEITNEQLRDIVIAKRGKLTLQKYAAQLGVSFQFLGKVISGDYTPGPTIAKRLGYDQVITVTFRKRKPRKAAKAKAAGKK
jgi:ribosomal protein L11